MFRTLSIIGFIVCFVCLAACCIVSPCKGCGFRPGQILRRLIRLFTLIFVEQRLSLVGVLRKLVYLLALLCFVVLAVTGFVPRLFLNETISGYWLMLHATFAPIFAVCLAVLTVMWASHCRFTGSDWPWLQRLIRRVTLPKTPEGKSVCPVESLQAERQPGCGRLRPDECSNLGQKITFWLIVVLALPLILSIISSMFPFFGTHWQELLLDTHRYSALLLALAVIVHTYLTIRVQMNK